MEKHILIIDDFPDIIELLKDILEPQGYKITAVAEVTDIIDMVKLVKPDLVIVDYILEGINGGEYCSQIKKHPDLTHIPVMILSGYPQVILSLGDYGADAILYKPFDIDKLSKTVFQMIARHKSGVQ